MESKVSNTTSAKSYYNPPARLISEQEYRQKIKELSSLQSGGNADDEFLKRLDCLTDELRNMIFYNTDELTCTGKVYYVSGEGDDNNDGNSPEKAWKTLDKVNNFTFENGDMVLFKRGEIFRGHIFARSGVSYSAYGRGAKPKICAAYDGIACGEWVKTEHENIWRLDFPFADKDIPTIVFNDGETYANKKLSISCLKEDLDFVYNSDWCEEKENDNKVYLYSSIDPSVRFSSININQHIIVVALDNTSRPHDITLHNLELLYGRGAFMATNSRNLKMSYCVCGWSGGHFIGKDNHIRYGGGAGGWLTCDGFYFDHCYIYQQFDSGVTPQYHWVDKDSSVFKNFITSDCLFETTEYTLEYFNTQTNVTDNCFDGMYFGYNICRLGGQGFGDKTDKSAYIKSWGHENTCVNCKIEYNVFDRAAALSLQIYGHNFGDSHENVDYNYIPKLSHNIYIEPKNKIFAEINGIKYPFNGYSHKALERLGVEDGAVYLYSK